MLIITTSKTPTNFDKLLDNTLFKVKSGLYVGNVTKRVRENIRESIIKNYTTGSIFMIWNNANSHSGFELIEISGDSNKNTLDFDGIIMPIIKSK